MDFPLHNHALGSGRSELEPTFLPTSPECPPELLPTIDSNDHFDRVFARARMPIRELHDQDLILPVQPFRRVTGRPL